MPSFEERERASRREEGMEARVLGPEPATETRRAGEEQEQEATRRAERQVASVEHAAETIRRAQEANNLAAWQAAHDQLGTAIDAAAKAIDHARSSAASGGPDQA